MQTEKKKGFSISKLFFEDLEDETKTQSTATPNIPAARPEETQQPTTVKVADDNIEKFKSLLSESLEEKALNTFDYLKFKKSLDSLRSVISDESSRFKAAFVTAKTMGVTKEALISSSKHYTTILEEEQTEFDKNAVHQNQNRITASEKEIKNIENTINEKGELIKKLTEEIGTLTSNKNQLSLKVQEEKIRSTQLTSAFSAAWKELSDEIESNTKKITTYITE